VTDNANNRPTIRRSFWLGMIEFSFLLIAICLPLYFATSSFFADRYAREREFEEVYDEAESAGWHLHEAFLVPTNPVDLVPTKSVDDDSD
jgi:hypothetical protein